MMYSMDMPQDASRPYWLSAGVLTLIVHVMFLAMLYLGVRWRVQPPQGLEVDLWSELPQNVAPAPAAPPPPPPAPPEVVKEQPVKQPATPAPDINVADKKQDQKKEKEKEKEKEKPDAKTKQADAARKDRMDMRDLMGQAERVDRKSRAAQSAEQVAISGEVGKAKDMIRSKIRHNIVMPPDVAEKAKAEYTVTLLPDGSVLSATLSRSSGNAAYDTAVERAIWKSQPLPLPPSEAAREQFINPNPLKLVFSPSD
jgi:colicin import membrane protein